MSKLTGEDDFMKLSYSVSEAKARFSEVIRQVRAGSIVTITYRGEPVAEIHPIEPQRDSPHPRPPQPEFAQGVKERSEALKEPPPNVPVVSPSPADLRAALHDLEGAEEEAREEGFLQPSAQAIDDARRLLGDLYRLRACRMETYPTPDGEIAILVPGGRGQSVLVLCASGGEVLCLVNLNGEHRRAKYSSAATIPDGFVTEALNELDASGQPQ